MTIVFDSGAIIAAERNDRRITAVVKAAQANRTAMLVPATVLAETWRGQLKEVNVSRFLKTMTAFPNLTYDTGRAAGCRLAKSLNTSIVDGNVVDIAIAGRPSTIITADPSDIMGLLSNAGVSHALHDAGNKKNVDVFVFAI